MTLSVVIMLHSKYETKPCVTGLFTAYIHKTSTIYALIFASASYHSTFTNYNIFGTFPLYYTIPTDGYSLYSQINKQFSVTPNLYIKKSNLFTDS